MTVDVRHCIELESAAKRLACFGAEVDAALAASGGTKDDGSSAALDSREADRGQSAGPDGSTRRERRARHRAVKRAGDESAAAEPAAPESAAPESADGRHSATIRAVRERLPNSYVITLDSGQVWEQTAPKPYLLRPGAKVTLYRTRWGDAYRLAAEGSGSHIQVRRVR